jgi:NAD(P)-dependent dehydrogenase (short-subunit alcohol dehydrogenase family)
MTGLHPTAVEMLQGINLAGKTAVVTGGSSGIGVETVRALAASGAKVVFTSRDAQNGRAAAESLRAEIGNPDIEATALDLASMASIDAFIARIRGGLPALHMLILNAGMLSADLKRNAQGIESQLMSNFVGHQLIAAGLAPLLIAAAPSRIVTLTSCGHKASPVLFEDPNFEHHAYDTYTAYAQSKTACALLAVELNRRLAPRGVLAFAVHPGSIFETNLTTSSGLVDPAVPADVLAAQIGLLPEDRKNLEQGASTTVWAATAPALDASGGGQYLEDVRIAVDDDPYPYRGVRAYARDPQAARRVWALGEVLTGRRLDIGDGRTEAGDSYGLPV